MLRIRVRLVLVCLLSIGWVANAPDIYGAEKDKDEKISALMARNSYTESVRMSDDVVIALHLPRPHEDAGAVLDIAKDAYEKIVFEYGFNREGFSVSQNDPGYVFEKDRVIDIFVLSGDLKKCADSLGLLGGHANPPCFDVLRGSDNSVDAVVFLPENIWDILADGRAAAERTVEGMLIHELCHVVLYHYNKNVAAWNDRDYAGQDSHEYFGKDWYAEGLARYFETLAGNYEHFFDGGYRKGDGIEMEADKDGVNYITQHPTEPFYKSSYDYALFWAYIHDRFGMEKIEELSSVFRSIRPRDVVNDAPEKLSRVLGVPFDILTHEFAQALLNKDFDPRLTAGLKDINCKSMKARGVVTKLDPWANDFIRISDQNLIEKNSINIECQRGTVVSTWIIFNDGTRQVNRIDFDGEKNAFRFQIPEEEAGNVREIMLIVTNRTDENKIKISACPRES